MAGVRRARRQLKRELGPGPYEGRGWLGVRHHLALAQIAFLQHLRLRGKKRRRVGAGRR